VYTWTSLQECPEPSCETSRFKRLHQPCLQCSEHPVQKEPAGLVQRDRKKPRRLHSYSMAWGTAFSVGCHSLHCFLLPTKSYSRRGRWAICRHETLKMHWTVFHSCVTVESHGPLSDTTASFREELGREITDRPGEPLEAQFLNFLFQRVSVLIQRFNCILFRETLLMKSTQTSSHSNMLLCFWRFFCFNPRDPYYRGYK